jgi:CRP/FNR family transcriptional regulator, cyclic AMP receptor protein
MKCLCATETLARRGELVAQIAVIVTGSIELSVTNQSGRRHILTVLRPGQHYGLIPAIDEKPAFYSADAAEECTLLMLPREVLVHNIARSEALLMGVLRATCSSARLVFLSIADHHLLSPPARIARYLLMLSSSNAGTGQSQVSIPCVHLSQSDLADMLSLTRQTLNIALKKLEKLNLVRIGYSSVELIDVVGLKQLVDAEF